MEIHKYQKHKNKSRRRRGGDLQNNIIDGVATFGRITTIMSTIFFTFISIVMIGIGIYIVTRKETFDDSATTNPNITPAVATNKQAPKWVGWTLIIVGIFILISTWVWLYFVWNYKSVAAVAGVAEGVDIIGDTGNDIDMPSFS